MTKTYTICAAIIIAALTIIVGPDVRESYYENKCEGTGGTAYWLASSPASTIHDGLTTPYCKGLDGTLRAM